MVKTPIFNRNDPERNSVDRFAEDMELFFAMKNTPTERKIVIFDAAIHTPAKTHFDNKRNADRFGVRARVDADAATPAAEEAFFQMQYQARLAWLRERYHGEDQQCVIQTKLF